MISLHSFEQNLFLPFWRSKMSVNLMVEKADKRYVWLKRSIARRLLALTANLLPS